MAFLRCGRLSVTVATSSARSTNRVWYVSGPVPVCGSLIAGTILAGMGLNPFRPQQHSATDYLMVVAAVLATAALVAWAFLG